MRIGWIGLGSMGAVMAPRLAAAGLNVCGFDADPEKGAALESLGVPGAASIAALAAGSDVVIATIPHDAALVSVAQAVGANLPPGGCFIDMSTVSPEASARAAALLAAAGIDYLRAPVSGSTGLAKEGRLSILVSGPAPAFEAHRALLGLLGGKLTYLGAGEEARVAKLVVNTIIAAINNALAEALHLGQRSGLDWDVMIDLIGGSAAASPYVASKIDKLKARDWTPAATVSLIAKDLDLALDLARRQGAFMPAAALHRQMLAAMEAKGASNLDMASLVTLYDFPAGEQSP